MGIFTDDELSALESSTTNEGLFLRLETDPVTRVWLGVQPIKPGVTTLDPTNEVYNGFGQIQDLPAIRQFVNGGAEQIEFHLSGVEPRFVAMAANESAAVRYKPISIGWAVMTPTWKMIGPIHWYATALADLISVDIQGATDSDNVPTCRLTLMASSLFTNRLRSKYSYWVDQDQQGRSPGDRFCELTGRYSEIFTKKWPA
jgi:hypothetical protein